MLLVAKTESDFIDELMVSIKHLQDAVDKIDLAHVKMSEKVDTLQNDIINMHEANNKIFEKVDQLHSDIKTLSLESKGSVILQKWL